jgi:hypothetical protein
MSFQPNVRLAGSLLCAAALLVACGGGEREDSRPGALLEQGGTARILSTARAIATPASDVTVIAVNKVRETRINRTTFEYEFTVSIKNGSTNATSISANLIGTGSGTVIVDGQVQTGPVAATLTKQASDTITLRHDRQIPFDLSALRWKFQVTASIANLAPGAPSRPVAELMPRSEVAIPSERAVFDQSESSQGLVLRTKLIVEFKPEVTVALANDLILGLSGTIVRSYPRTSLVELLIPDPGSVRNLRAILERVRSDPRVRYALLQATPTTAALPPAVGSGPSAPLNPIAHHLAVGFAPAWNAMLATKGQDGPVLAVADRFGRGGAPQESLLSTTFLSSGSGFALNWDGIHGYGVLGIAGAAFGDMSSEVTGAYPGPKPLDYVVVDIPLSRSGKFGESAISDESLKAEAVRQGHLIRGLPTNESQILDEIERLVVAGRKVVLNASFGASGDLTGWTSSDREAFGQFLLSEIKSRGAFKGNSRFADSVFIAAAAGNNRNISSRLAGAWQTAIYDGSLKNGLTVANVTADASRPMALGCLDSTSGRPGHVAAVGDLSPSGIWTYENEKGELSSSFNGTSAATPQVAGLAAYIWTINPRLKAVEVASAISGNTRTAACPNASDQANNVIDAYAAVLSVDDAASLQGTGGNIAFAPARMAILDLDGDGKFTLNDARYFADALGRGKGQGGFDLAWLIKVAQATGGEKNYDPTRFDLNGDGSVGGKSITSEARFNLDIKYTDGRTSDFSGSVAYLGADGKLVSIPKLTVKDHEIICYYARTALWSDSAANLQMFEDLMSDNDVACPGSVKGPRVLLKNSRSSLVPGFAPEGCCYYVKIESDFTMVGFVVDPAVAAIKAPRSRWPQTISSAPVSSR